MSEVNAQVPASSQATEASSLPQALKAVNAATEADELQQLQDSLQQPGSDLWLYRDRTLAILRRYFRFSIEVGRLPSLLGRELFRARVSSYSAGTFEDAVIFVHDVEQCLEDLNQFDRKVLGKVVFQDYTQDEAAHLLGCGRKKIWRRVPEILDVVSEKLLEHGLLYRFPVKTPIAQKSCQGGKNSQFLVSDCC
jgi:hypothetical protein